MELLLHPQQQPFPQESKFVLNFRSPSAAVWQLAPYYSEGASMLRNVHFPTFRKRKTLARRLDGFRENLV
jgi:hypothetical protein